MSFVHAVKKLDLQREPIFRECNGHAEYTHHSAKERNYISSCICSMSLYSVQSKSHKRMDARS
jgi:hypothetical protein